MSEAKEYFIIKRGYYYRPDNCGYTDRPILAGLYTETEAIQTTHPNGQDGPRDGMFYKHESKCGDADYLAFKAQAQRIEELEAKLEVAVLAEREACAAIALKVAENGDYFGEASVDSTNSIYQQGAEEVFEAIRSRSQEGQANE